MAHVDELGKIEADYRPVDDPTLSLARAVIIAERMYLKIQEDSTEGLRADVLVLLAHLRVARKFSS
jgi:hypothetical protein